MKLPLWRRLIGCRDLRVSWKHGYHDARTVRGMLALRFWERVEWWIELPSNLRWSAANRLSALAQRLRGDQTYDIGYGVEANLAGMLEDAIRMKLILWDMDRRPLMAEEDPADEWKFSQREAEQEEFEELLGDLAALGGLAKATSWLEYWKLVRARDYRDKRPAPEKPEFDY